MPIRPGARRLRRAFDPLRPRRARPRRAQRRRRQRALRFARDLESATLGVEPAVGATSPGRGARSDLRLKIVVGRRRLCARDGQAGRVRADVCGSGYDRVSGAVYLLFDLWRAEGKGRPDNQRRRN